jgi:thioredoxin-dependent peroxiredoxin
LVEHLVYTERVGGSSPSAPTTPDIVKEMVMRNALIVATALLALPAEAALKPGATAPSFQTEAAIGGKPFTFSMDAARKRGPVVLYFFPAAFTPGCTVEAREFAEATPEFRKLGATVIGAAGDDIAKLTKFSVEECRNKFAVGVATPAMIKGFDVAMPLAGRSNRTSYVIAPNGQIIYVYSNNDYRGHAAGALQAVRDWHAAQKKHKHP